MQGHIKQWPKAEEHGGGWRGVGAAQAVSDRDYRPGRHAYHVQYHPFLGTEICRQAGRRSSISVYHHLHHHHRPATTTIIIIMHCARSVARAGYWRRRDAISTCTARQMVYIYIFAPTKQENPYGTVCLVFICIVCAVCRVLYIVRTFGAFEAFSMYNSHSIGSATTQTRAKPSQPRDLASGGSIMAYLHPSKMRDTAPCRLVHVRITCRLLVHHRCHPAKPPGRGRRRRCRRCRHPTPI